METALIDAWLPQPDVLVVDDAALTAVRDRVRAVGASIAVSAELTATMALVATELATNQLRHADSGRMSVLAFVRDGVPGIEVLAADRGRGIEDPAIALEDGASTTPGKGIGAGLGAVFRMSDEVDVDVRVGEGVFFRARKLAVSPRFRSEVAIFSRPCPGETVSGDDAAFARSGESLTIAVADGLGHGPYARAASSRAIACVAADAGGPPDRLVRAADKLADKTRGVTMGIIRIDRSAHVVDHAGVGDVLARVDRHGGIKQLAGQSGTLGVGRLRSERLRVDSEVVAPGDYVIMSSDGISSGAEVVRPHSRHPLLTAHEIVSRFARATDDALVVVARVA